MRTMVRVVGVLLTASLAGLPSGGVLAAQEPSPSAAPARQIGLDDAVRLALEHNINLQVERIKPQIQDEQVALAAASFTPTWTWENSYNGTNSPPDSFLSGSEGGGALETGVFRTNVGIRQQVPRGGLTYAVGWDASRATTNSLFSNFNPRLNSSLSLSVVQPLWRNRTTDALRTQLRVSSRNLEMSQDALRGIVADTVRAVKSAYWDLKYAIANLDVQRQNLELARQTLLDNRSRVQIGTMAPIDIVEAEAEVARNEEGVIVAGAAVTEAEDQLRTLLLDPGSPGFWDVRLDPTDSPRMDPVAIDMDKAIEAARVSRADRQRAERGLANVADNLRLYRDQSQPEVNLQVDYALAGLGGRQFLRGSGFPGPVEGTVGRSLGSVLADILTVDFPAWTVGVTVSYPIGRSSADVNLARTGLEQRQAQLQLEQIDLQIATQVRTIGRKVGTNIKRIDATRAARLLAERRLDAEQRKFGVGTSTSFLVFQAQRELAAARVNELKALLDYNKSLADFEAVQETPVSGGSVAITVSSATAAGQGGTVTTAGSQGTGDGRPR
ncbi:MAG: TolC family protein [Vicinamibacterales bacterium]